MLLTDTYLFNLLIAYGALQFQLLMYFINDGVNICYNSTKFVLHMKSIGAVRRVLVLHFNTSKAVRAVVGRQIVMKAESIP